MSDFVPFFKVGSSEGSVVGFVLGLGAVQIFGSVAFVECFGSFAVFVVGSIVVVVF